MRKLSKFEWSIFAIIAAAAILSFLAMPSNAKSDGLLHVYFLNVGQGDAIFIQAPNGNQVLVDGGPDSKVIQELAKVMPFHDRSIDLLVLTHPDADHITGLIEVLDRYEVEQILENPIKSNAAAYAKWNELKREALVTEAGLGQKVWLDDGIALWVLFPVGTTDQSKSNNNSIVIKLVYGEVSLLLTGDIEAKVERELLARGINVDSDLLKVPHHGSKTSTTKEFLDAVTPETAFIQVGVKNRYGHPHPTVLDRLEDYGIKYYRNDIDGLIELVIDGLNYKINSNP